MTLTGKVGRSRYQVKKSKPRSEKQRSHILSHMWNLSLSLFLRICILLFCRKVYLLIENIFNDTHTYIHVYTKT
jgi:hypothetical protein